MALLLDVGEGSAIESTTLTLPAFVLQSATEVVTISICKEHLFGIIGISLTPEEPGRAIVSAVEPGTSASMPFSTDASVALIQMYDELLEINGVAVESAVHAVTLIRSAPAGELVIRKRQCPESAQRAALFVQAMWRTYWSRREGYFLNLDELALQQITATLNVREIANLSRCCRQLRSLCACIMDSRARACIALSCEPGMYGAWDVVAAAAEYVGGWGALLAGRQLPLLLGPSRGGAHGGAHDGARDGALQGLLGPSRGGMPPAQQPSQFRRGQRVEIVGLNGPADLHGKCGSLLDWAPDMGHWGVKMDVKVGWDEELGSHVKAGECVRVKPQNLVPGPPPASDACLVMWDMVVQGKEVAWSGVMPLAYELGSCYYQPWRAPGLAFAFPTVDVEACTISPLGTDLPGMPPASAYRDPHLTAWDLHLSPPGAPGLPDGPPCVMSATIAELAQGTMGNLSHRISLLAPGSGEILIAQSPPVGSKLYACFQACAEFERVIKNLGLFTDTTHEEKVSQDLSKKVRERMGLAKTSAPINPLDRSLASTPHVQCRRSQTAQGELLDGTFDLRLITFTSEQRHTWWGCEFETSARLHIPTETVRFFIRFLMEDAAWQGVLAPRPKPNA